ncbi:MAG: DUF5667 domain-containing protein [Patescibacteria group bacterium]
MYAHSIVRTLKQLRDEKRGIHPDPAWMLRVRAQVQGQVQASCAQGTQAKVSFVVQAWQAVCALFPTSVIAAIRGPAFAVASLIFVVLGGSIMSVSAAEKSLPGDVLFSVKLATEQTRIMLAKTQGQKLKLKTEFVGRRVQEVRDLVASPSPDQGHRIKAAAELLKRDLDTVKTQLHEADGQVSAGEIASAAKTIDEQSTAVVLVLKDARDGMSAETKTTMTEAEVAAVTTGVKAVQILIDAHDRPEVKDVMSDEELLQVISNRVQGMEAGIADAVKIVASSTPEALSLSATSTAALTGSTSTTQEQIQDAQTSIAETKVMIQESNLGELKDKLGEVAKVVANVEKTVGALPATSSSTDDGVSTDGDGTGSTSSTTSTFTTSTVPPK